MKTMLRRVLSMLMCVTMLITSIPAWGEEDSTIQVLEMIQTIEEQASVSGEEIPEAEEIPVMEEEPVPEVEIPAEIPAEETEPEKEFEELEEVEITFEDIPELFGKLPEEDEAEEPVEETLEQFEEPAVLSEDAELAAVIDYLVSDVADFELIFDKVYILYHRLLDRVSHGEGNTAYDALVKGSANREGYALAYAALLSAVNIENEVIYGSNGKVWNLVHDGARWTNDGILMFDGCWYHVDAYADDGAVPDRHLALTDGAMRADGYEWSGHFYPDQIWETAVTKCPYGENAVIIDYAELADAKVQDAVLAGHEGQYEHAVFYDAAGVCNLADKVLAVAENLGVADAIHIVDDGCFVEVWFVPASAIVPASKTITIGVKEQVSIANWTTEPAGSFVKGEVTYSTKSAAIAAIDENGVITGKKAGTTNAYISAPGLAKVTVKVVVKAAPKKITLTNVPAVLGVGEKVQLGYTLTSGSVSTVTYKSSDENVLVVHEDGMLVPLAPGSATITASTHVEGVEASAEIIVKAMPTAIRFSESAIVLGKGDSKVITAALPEGEAGAITFESSDETIATVDAAGKVKAVKAGTATITASTYVEGVTAACTVEVKAAPTAVGVTAERTTIGVGEKIQLATTLKPEDAESTLSFSSSKATVASVDEEGEVTAVKAGSATITVKTHNAKKKTIKITVKAAPTSVEIDADRTVLGVGEALQLGYTLSKGSAGSVTFDTSDANIATITEDGLLTPVAEGAVTITATAHNGVSGELAFEIKKQPSEVLLSDYDLVLGKGDTKVITATLPEGEAGAITFGTSDKAIVTVDANGKIKGVKAGTATITASTYAEGVFAACEVEVKAAPTSVGVTAERTTIGVGEKIQLATTLKPEDAEATLTFSSSKAAVASVDAEGEVTAVKAGAATITVKTHNAKKKTIKITVKAAPTSVEIDADRTVLGVGEELQLGYILSKSSAGSVSFSSGDDTIATVTSDGLLVPVAPGTVTITATAHNGVSGELAFEIKKQPSEVLLSDYDLVLGKGATKTITAALPEGETGAIVFATSDKAIATVDANGKIKAVKAGTATITATAYNDVYAECTVEVKAAPTAVAVSAERTTIGVGEKLQLETSLKPADAASTLTFSSSKAAVATVDEDGVVTAVKAGAATITAKTHNGKKKTIKITVKAAPASVTIEAPRTKLGVGESMVLSSAIPSGTVGTVSYLTSDETIATVNAAGVVQAVGEGTVTLTAVTQNPEVYASVAVEIVSAPTQVVPSFDWKDIRVGTSAAITYTTDNGNVGPVTFASSDEAVATVDANGLIKAVSVGTAEIYIYSYVDGVYGVANVNVCPDPTAVTLSDAVNTIVLGEELQLEAILTPDDAMADFTYASSNETVATVDANGVVTALAAGSAVITATTHNGLSATLEISVITGPEKVKGLAIAQNAPASLTLTWDASRNTDYYKVYVFENEAWTLVAQTENTTYTAENLTSNVEYKYAVEACMESSEGLLVAEKSDAAVRTVVEPLEIVSVEADAKVAYAGDTVTWTAAIQGGKQPYAVTFAVSKDGAVIYTGAAAEDNTFSYTFAEAGNYSVACSAEDAYGNTAEAAAAEIAALELPGKVANLAIAQKDLTIASLTLTWDAEPNAQYYKVYVDDNGWTELAQVEENTYVAENLTTGKEYKFAVEACVAALRGEVAGEKSEAAVRTVVEELAIVSFDADRETAYEGDTVQWTMVAKGGMQPYSYAYSVYQNGQFVVGGTDASDVLAYTMDIPGEYYAVGTVFDAYGNSVEITTETITAWVKPTAVTLTADVDSIFVGQQIQLSAALVPADAVDTIAFASSDDEIASVDERGMVKGLNEGSVTITVTTGLGLTASIELQVEKAPANFTTEENEDGTLTITGLADEFSGLMFIPASIDGKAVSAIAGDAFADNQEITGVVIENGVSAIGFYAFADCRSMASVEIPASVKEIGEGAFNGSGLVSLVVPTSVETVGTGAFFRCDNLRTVEYGAKHVATGVFEECGSLRTVKFTGEPESIENCAFRACHSLVSITIPETVKRIGEYAFEMCHSLAELKLPATIEEFGEGVFNDTEMALIVEMGTPAYDYVRENGYNYVAIGASDTDQLQFEVDPETLNATLIGYGPVTDDIEYVELEGTLTVPATIADGRFTVTAIGDGAIQDFPYLTGIVLPDTVTHIGEWAFANNRNLRSITFGSGVETIAVDAFNGCESLTEVTIPDGCIFLGGGAFANCHNLRKIVIPESVVDFDDDHLLDNSDMVVVYCQPGSEAEAYAIRCKIPYNNGESVSLALQSVHATRWAGGLQEWAEWEAIASGNNLEYRFELYRNFDQLVDSTDWGTSNVYEYTFDQIGVYTLYAFLRDASDPETVLEMEARDLMQITDVDEETGFRYYNTSETEVMVAGYDREIENGTLTIPDTITGKAVVGITDGAFYGNSELQHVVLPASLRLIQGGAFANCWDLQSINLEDTRVIYIGNGAFERCDAVAEFNLPATLRTIGDYAFFGCAMEAITIPENVDYIGDGAFEECGNLKTVTFETTNLSELRYGVFKSCSGLQEIILPEGLEVILDEAFMWSGIAKIVLPSTLRSIESCAFQDCHNLQEINLEECTNLTYIGGGAFERCWNLQSVVIPDSVTEMGHRVFMDCHNLKSAVMGNGLTSTFWATFENCHSLRSVTLPENLEEIGNWAFKNCNMLSDVELPESVYSIGEFAFQSCHRLGLLVVSDNVSEFGPEVFSGADVVLQVNIGSPAYHYAREYDLKYIAIGDADNSGLCYEFNEDGETIFITGYDGELEGRLVIPSEIDGHTVTAIGDHAFENHQGISGVVIPATVEEIRDFAFHMCSRMISVEFEGASAYSLRSASALRYIGARAFGECDYLESLVVPEGVTVIGSEAFAYNDSMTSLTIPASVNEIGDDLVNGSNYVIITVPEGNSAIRDYAEERGIPYTDGKTTPLHVFKVREVDERYDAMVGDTVTWTADVIGGTGNYQFKYSLQRFDEEIFNTGWVTESEFSFECAESGPYWMLVSVTDGESTIEDARCENVVLVSNWSDEQPFYYFNINENEAILTAGVRDLLYGDVEVPQSIDGYTIVEISRGAFADDDDITSITLPEGVTYIGENVFSDMDSLRTVVLPSTLTAIESSAFENCFGLENITIPGSVQHIGGNAFGGCTSLSEVILEDGVGRIGEHAFFFTNVHEITIPGSAELSERAFADCESLEVVHLNQGITELAEGVFENCANLREVSLPESLTALGTSTFNNCHNLEDINLSGIKTVGDNAFGNCNRIGFADLSGAESIGIDAFANCHSLSGVEFGEGLSVIGRSAFNNCHSLSNIVFPSSLEFVDSWAFTDCHNLGEINLTGRGIGFGENVFGGSNVRLIVDKDSDLYHYAREWGYDYITFGEIVTDQFHYEFNHEEKTATIVGYGFEDYIELEGTLNIPETVVEEGEVYTITAIGNDVFRDQQGITALFIPGTVKSIGQWAFGNLRNLRALTISEGVETIDYDAFNGCESLTGVDIPSTVTFIGGGAFAFCWNLREIYFWQDADMEVDFTDDCVLDNSPWAVVYCYADSAAQAFAERRGIPYAYHDGSFESLAIMGVPATCWAGNEGEYAEWEVIYNGYDVEFLYEVIFNGEVIFESEWTDENTFGWICENPGKYWLNVTARFAGDENEENYAFCETEDWMTISMGAQDGSAWRYTIFGEGEDGITRIGITDYDADIENGELIIPDTIDGYLVDGIMEHAFEGRHEINRVVLNESLYSIMFRAFADCDGLESIEFTGNNLFHIDDHAFYDCDSLREINLPDSVGVIGSEAFTNIPLQSIKLPANLEYLGDAAFEDCQELFEVDMSAITKLEVIGQRAFNRCFSLQEIAIPDCVKEISYDAFAECYELRKVTLGSGLETLQSWAFFSCCALEEINLGDCKMLTYLGEYVFEHCCSLREIVIPDSVTEMQHRVFLDCHNLETAVLGSGLNTTRIATFENCHNLRSVVLPENLEGIDSWAFNNCHSLSEIIIPANLKFIDQCAFENCGSLAELTMPAGVEYINENAFNGADVALIVEMGTYAHERAIECGWNYIPIGEADAGRIAYYHENDYIVVNGYDGPVEGELEIPAYIDDRPVTIIDVNAFQGQERMTKVIIPETVEVILWNAFEGCHHLNTVEFRGNNLLEIYENVFAHCHSLTSVHIPDGVKMIGHNAFGWSEQLQELHVPASVEDFAEQIIEGSERCVLYVEAGSPAEAYAIEKGLPYDNGSHHPFEVLQVYNTDWTDVVGDSAAWEAYVVGADQITAAEPYNFQLYRDGELYIDFGWSAEPFIRYTFEEGGYYEMAMRMRKTDSESTATDLCFGETNIIGWADETDMFRYNFCGENEVRITGFTGMEGNTLVIPETIDEATVVGIAANAFNGRGEIEWVELPATIRFIDEWAFAYCENLMGINLGDTQIQRIGGWAFESCHKLDNVVLPKTLEELGDETFWHCCSMQEITLPENLRFFGERCFQECYNLHTVNIESTKLEEIAWGAFVQTHSLQNITIPEGVITIRDEAFCESGVNSVILPSTLENIDSAAFASCCNLQEINLGDCHKLTYLGDGVFDHCCSLREIEMPASVDYYGNNLFTNCHSLEKAVMNAVARVEIEMVDPDGTEWVDVIYTTRWSTFENCHSLREVVLPAHTTSIANWAFRNCHSLETVTVPDALGGIGEFAFENCHNLREFTLGESIYNIEDGVFDGCGAVLYVYPDTYAYERVRETDWNYTIIGAEADANGIHFEFSENGEEAIACWYDGDLIGDLVIPAYVEDEEGIERPVTVINDWGFCGADQLMSVTIPETVQYIGEGAFADCWRMRSVNIAEGSQLDEIARDAFANCESLSFVNLEAAEDLRIIGDRAFAGCRSLNSLTFPGSIMEIGEDITDDCPLTAFIVEAGSLAEAYAIGNGIPYRINGNEDFEFCLAYVGIDEHANWPGERATWRAYAVGGNNVEYQYRLYRGGIGILKTEWTDSDTFTYEEFTQNGCYMVGVTARSDNGDGTYTYYPLDENGEPDRKYADGYVIVSETDETTGLNFSVLSNDPEEDGYQAVITGAADELGGEITIPSTINYDGIDYEVVEIINDAFAGNPNITGVTVEADVYYIGDRAFHSMENLRYLNLPASLEEIRWEMASWNPNLEEVTIAGAIEINDGAFQGCYNLRKVTLPENLYRIGNWAFAECYSLEEINLPASLEEIGDHAFAWCHSLQLDEIPENVWLIESYAFEECHSIGEIVISANLEDMGEDIFCNSGVYVVAEVGAPILRYCLEWGYDFEPVGEADNGRLFGSFEADGYWITGYDGEIIGDLVIPETVTNVIGEVVPVTAIFEGAFRSQPGLTNVFIPATVKTIHTFAFADCDRLRSVGIAEGSELTEIGAYAFAYCERMGNVELHNAQKLEAIGEYAFDGCHVLEEVTIAETVKEMGREIFRNCYRVRLQVTAGSTAETYAIANGLLYDNGSGYPLNVMEVTVERWATFVEEEAEWRVHAIGGQGDYQYQYQLYRNGDPYGEPSGWTDSDTYSFQCNESGVYFMHAQVKDASGAVTEFKRGNDGMIVRIYDEETTIHYAEIGENKAIITGMDEVPNDLVIPETVAGCTVVEIADNAFESRGEIESLTLPETVVFIGPWAFADCGNMHTVNLPAGLQGIDEFGFAWCRNLRSLELPDGLIYMGNCAIHNCESLEEIVIPDSVTDFGEEVMSACFNLRSVKLPAGMDMITRNFFAECYSLEYIEIPGSVTEIGTGAFINCESLKEITIPASVKTIGDNAFSECYNLETLNLNEGLEYIGAAAFFHNESLKELIMPDTITKVRGQAFDSCYSLETVRFSENLEHITNWSFGACYALKEIVVPASVGSIGAYAFCDCVNLEKVTLPENGNLTIIEQSAFFKNESLKEIVIPDTVTEIGPIAFDSCYNLESVKLSANLTQLNNWTFANCHSLKSVEIPAGVKHIGTAVFAENYDLSSVILPEGLESIGADCFLKDGSLTILLIPESVSDIGENAFAETNGSFMLYVAEGSAAQAYAEENGIAYELSNGSQQYQSYLYIANDSGTVITAYLGAEESVVVPETINGMAVTEIGDGAFEGNTALTEIDLPDTVTVIGARAFANCTSLAVMC